MLWLIAALAFIALTIYKLPFPFIILAAGLIGYYAGRVMPYRFEAGKANVASWGTSRPALLDEDTPIHLMPFSAGLDYSERPLRE